MCGVWPSVSVINAPTPHLQPTLPIMGLGNQWSLDFANPLNLTMWHNLYFDYDLTFFKMTRVGAITKL